MLSECKTQLKNLKIELKSLLTDEFKDLDPDTFYKLTSILNKYFGRNPYEDIDQ